MKSRIYCKTASCRKWSKLSQDGYCPSCKLAEVEVVEEPDECICDLCNEAILEDDNKVIGCD